MTTADEEKLCRDIAEEEGWTLVDLVPLSKKLPTRLVGKPTDEWLWNNVRRSGRKRIKSRYDIPLYLTDPAETLRMFISLIEWADIKVSEFDELLTLELYRRSDDEEIEECEPWKHLRLIKGSGWFEDGAFPLAVAEAYLARLKETK